MENTSGLKPLGIAVLVKPYVPEYKTESGIEIPNFVKERMLMADQRAVVIEAGPEAWLDEQAPRAKPGDRVMLAKYAGHLLIGTADGVQYRMVNCDDIFAGITEENNDLNNPLKSRPSGKPEFNEKLRDGFKGVEEVVK